MIIVYDFKNVKDYKLKLLERGIMNKKKFIGLGIIACLVISFIFTNNSNLEDEKVIFASVGENSFFL